MPYSNYKHISELFIKHLYCKGKLSMKDTLIRFARQGYDVNGSSSPEDGTDWQKWAHLSIGVEHIFQFHSNNLGTKVQLAVQIEPVFDGLSPEYKEIYEMWKKRKMPEADGSPIPTWMFEDCSQSNKSWEMLYEIPFRFAKGVRKKYPHDIAHLNWLDW